jgi:exodeoxyribonuclease VII large subunit
LFDASRKRALPAYPRSVGVVTSRGAAALHDVLTALARRAPQVRVIVYPSSVQGPEAPAALAAAIALASRRAEVDTLVVCRGGGSLEDLWAFNDERVVRAIVAAAMPVVCGVGHETDVTLADFAADLRAPTPTAAAELAAPMRTACLEALDAIAQAVQRRAHQALDMHSQRLDRTAQRLSRPEQRVRQQAQRLSTLTHRLATLLTRSTQQQHTRLAAHERDLRSAVSVRLSNSDRKLEGLSARIRALDPKQVLARGYAWLIDDAGNAVTSAQSVSVGASLQAVLSDGTADVLVTEVRSQTTG